MDSVLKELRPHQESCNSSNLVAITNIELEKDDTMKHGITEYANHRCRCNKCTELWRQHSADRRKKTLSEITPTDVLEFFMKVYKDPSTGCWIWTASKTPQGYGAFRNTQAHRYAYAAFYGGLPDEKVNIHHECNSTSCVNPAHLVALTTKEHAQHHAALRRARKDAS